MLGVANTFEKRGLVEKAGAVHWLFRGLCRLPVGPA